jgi:hypothetical protein
MNNRELIELSIQLNYNLNTKLNHNEIKKIFDLYDDIYIKYFYEALVNNYTDIKIDSKIKANIIFNLMFISMKKEIQPIYNINHKFNKKTDNIQKKYYHKFNSLIVS